MIYADEEWIEEENFEYTVGGWKVVCGNYALLE